ADTVPEPDALIRYVNYFIRPGARHIAAVTANMDVQNRTKLIAKSQTVEFSSIVGIIKRTQSAVFGGLYAYSGANTMYRKEALIDVGGFRQDRATEDISIAWDHQLNDWLSVFAPEIIFFMEVPVTLKMLYRHRKRWAKGGTEVWLTNFKKVMLHPFKHIGRTIIFIDQTLSIVWSIFFCISVVLFAGLIGHYVYQGNYEQIYITFTFSFVFICFEMVAGFFQLLASLIVDDRRRKLKYLLFAPLYMLLFWIVNAITIVTTFIPAVKTILGYGSGTWKSPERTKK
ncbi:glycosyltransferase, partial [Enterococcus faecium]|nr:glycosyltransferase [Enterococcus faecium]